jgi:hypothetical protein|tara:strand:- start:244 stop:414 length:171 start_codon:yes stop_codon:yes gene_type:complete
MPGPTVIGMFAPDVGPGMNPGRLMNFNIQRHSGESRNPEQRAFWTPAFAGVTKKVF